MRFKGDIIITDPCYICKEKEEVGKLPYSKDFFTYEAEEDYPDFRESTEEELREKARDNDLFAKMLKANFLPYQWRTESEQYKKENERYEAAIAEYRKNNISDWERCNYGEDFEELGIKNYICRDTIYGDWSCTTYNSDTNEVLGRFCADAGMVGVFLLDEVLKYNPDFNYHIERPWTTTLIKDFDGEIDFEIVHTEGVYEDDTEFHSKGEKWEDDSVSVVGKGNINFKTEQTGF